MEIWVLEKMISDREELKKLIAFYLNETLSEEEKKRVEEFLEKDPESERELVEFSRIREVIREEPLPEPPAYIYERINERIRKEKSFFQKLKSLIGQLYGSRAVSWGLVGAQAVLILFLLFRPVSPTYRTLSTTPSHQGVYVNVIFKDDTLEKDMRVLLNRVRATIVEGPTEEGLYVIKLGSEANLQEAIDVLKKSGSVKFVARAYR